MFKIQAAKGEDHRLQVLYEILLPFLVGGQPLARAMCEGQGSCTSSESVGPHMRDDSIEMRTPQRAKVCYFRCVLEALRYLARSQAGLSQPQVKQLMFAMRRMSAEMCEEDLEALPDFARLWNGHPPSPIEVRMQPAFRATTKLHPSDVRLMNIACKQIARSTIKEVHAGRLSVKGASKSLAFCHSLTSHRGVHELSFSFGTLELTSVQEQIRRILTFVDIYGANYYQQNKESRVSWKRRLNYFELFLGGCNGLAIGNR